VVESLGLRSLSFKLSITKQFFNMNNIQISARKAIVASIFFVSACLLLFIFPQHYRYSLILLLTIPLLVLSPANLFATDSQGMMQAIGLMITYGFSFVVFKLDSNNLLGNFTGTSVEELNSDTWRSVVGAFCNSFVALFYVIGVTVLSNSKLKWKEEVEEVTG